MVLVGAASGCGLGSGLTHRETTNAAPTKMLPISAFMPRRRPSVPGVFPRVLVELVRPMFPTYCFALLVGLAIWCRLAT
jgi:hypothetical protein